jgi:tRNA-2-methylthio-N6-dimethylallyladenosine synthase
MEHVKYSFGYMYAYSERPGMVDEKMEDDVSEATKLRVDFKKLWTFSVNIVLFRTQEFLEKRLY